ncbi:eukaryotic translation elongation factor 1 epsilon-1 [Hermetia illucens]|uniref:eukaryotic translation elongation factor 1 epsilon-1 n=1 Tax=Hermetia illucens TaxID=343691 RepID=UPI0018CC412A|nr:eukaryotic translation elongation factor 1 epsilon-1 [Hermetia illucens]
MCNVESIQKIANYLGVQPGRLGYNNEQVVTRTVKNQTQQGYATILSQLAKESKDDSSKTASLETQTEIRQWIDYAILYVAPGTKDKQVVRVILKDLNQYLLTRSYFVGYSLTLADLAIFYAIHDIVKSLTPIEKESYLNLSRWFNHLQKNEQIQQGADLINFTTIYLHGWATGTHM